jgi:hypothetical protein
MPAYIETPLDGIPPMLLPGIPGYFYGSRNTNLPSTRMQVTSVAITGDVATLGVVMVEGDIPAVGSLISVRGTQTTTSGGAPNFNVTNAALIGVSINSTTGVGTVTFALTSTNLGTTADAGEAEVPVPEVAEAFANGTSLQFTMQSDSGLPNNSRDIVWDVQTPSAPSAFSAALQVALVDEDSDYTTIDTATATGSRQVAGVRGNFIRVKNSGVSGGSSPTVIEKILI